MYRFDSLDGPDMTAALHPLLPDHDANEIEILRQLGRGSPGIALEFAGLKMGELEEKMQHIIRSGDADNAIRSFLAGQLSLKAAQPRYEAFLRRVPSVIAEAARNMPANDNMAAIDAWKKATELAGRAIGVSLDKNAVILEMGRLLASLNQHKHASR
jgi:DNA polymerase-3 subunit delta'